jgi:hypothetical protein
MQFGNDIIIAFEGFYRIPKQTFFFDFAGNDIFNLIKRFS